MNENSKAAGWAQKEDQSFFQTGQELFVDSNLKNHWIAQL